MSQLLHTFAIIPRTGAIDHLRLPIVYLHVLGTQLAGGVINYPAELLYAILFLSY